MANTGNTQQIIDYGVAPNDGTGDPLRTAFIKTDENFSNIWSAGPVGSNITIGNNTVQVNNTNGNLVLKPNGVGVVQTNASIVPDFDQLRDLGSANNRFRSLYVSGGLDLGGNITAGNLTVENLVDLLGDVTVGGNLTVNGTTLTVNVANLDIADKNITLANGSPNAQSANGAGITVAGANAQLTYISATDSWNSNKTLIAENDFSVGGLTDNGWDFALAGGFLSFPSGASWQSQINLDGTSDEYIRSATNGYLNLSTYDSVRDLASELDIEHGLVRIKIHNGTTAEWDFREDGTFATTGNIQANANGNVWACNNDTMLFPSGASWRSDAVNKDEYISGAVDGYLNFSTYDSSSNIASEIKLEHGQIRLKIHNGSDVEWDFQEDGTFNASGNIEANIVKTRPTVTASLPLAAQVGAGARAMVTDANDRTWGNLLVGGAGNTVPVWSDGTNWYIG